MTDDLPITLTTDGLFEANDKASRFLIRKLEAWLNFQALVSHWYEDEAKVISFALTLLPEVQFYRQEVETDWQTLSDEGRVVAFQYQRQDEHFKVLILLSNLEIDGFMTDSNSVEPSLRKTLRRTLNLLAPQVGLPTLLA